VTKSDHFGENGRFWPFLANFRGGARKWPFLAIFGGPNRPQNRTLRQRPLEGGPLLEACTGGSENGLFWALFGTPYPKRPSSPFLTPKMAENGHFQDFAILGHFGVPPRAPNFGPFLADFGRFRPISPFLANFGVVTCILHV
jgi:hypothetical protein